MKVSALTLTTLLIILSTSFASAQILHVDLKKNVKSDSVDTYQFTGLGENQTYFRMPYGSPKIYNPGATKYYEGKIITKVELVYTDYPVGENLSLLNKRRLAALYAVAPEVFSNPYAEWSIIKQTSCKSEASAMSMFHGWAITYADSSAPAVTMGYMGSMLEHGGTLKDSTVLKILERNKDNWSQSLVMADLTGSMSPYSVQLLMWMKLNMGESLLKHFVFFNDGDATPDEEKVIGETGGMYDIQSGNWEEVANKAYESLRKGSGGDAAENDLEAVLYGLKQCPDCIDVILVADNNADVRDMELLSKVDKPVKVIVCGADTFFGLKINPQYLTIARETGGSIHTLEEDLHNLMELKEGEEVTIGEITFVIQDHEFVQVRSM